VRGWDAIEENKRSTEESRIISYANVNVNGAAFRIRESHHFSCQRFSIAHVNLELARAVFAQSDWVV